MAAAFGQAIEVGGMYAVSPKRDCPHLTPDQLTTAVETYASVTTSSPCADCGNKGENWVCLKCAAVRCSRFVAGHMVQHNIDDNHCLAVSFSDLSFWCYSCDSYIESPALTGLLKRFQEIKFGKEIEALVQSLQGLQVNREEAKVEEPRPSQEESKQEEPKPAAEPEVAKPEAAKPEAAEPEAAKPEEAKVEPHPTAAPKAWDQLSQEEICDRIRSGEFKRITVMTGAGISVSAGIPDFRTPGTGLYSQLEALNLPTPESVFTLSYFESNPQPFFALAKSMFGQTYKPTPTHYFIRLLHEKGLLRMCFTQNIDGLELQAGIPSEKLVQAHGHCNSSHCIACKREYPHDSMMEHIRAEEPPRCEHCGAYAKPDIVFFGESLPDRFMFEAQKLHETDLLIVIGTSLVVFPFAALVGMVPKEAPRILINREMVANIAVKARPKVFKGDCDAVVWDLCRLLGWEQELRALVDS